MNNCFRCGKSYARNICQKHRRPVFDDTLPFVRLCDACVRALRGAKSYDAEFDRIVDAERERMKLRRMAKREALR